MHASSEFTKLVSRKRGTLIRARLIRRRLSGVARGGGAGGGGGGGGGGGQLPPGADLRGAPKCLDVCYN